MTALMTVQITNSLKRAQIADFLYSSLCVCEVGTVGMISDYQPEGPGFNPRPGQGLNLGWPSFATPSDVELLSSLSTFYRGT